MAVLSNQANHAVKPLMPPKSALFITALFVFISTIYSILVPSWEAPDEPAHFQYVMHLRQTWALPVQKNGGIETAHHPPLFYALATLLTAPVDVGDTTGKFHLNRRFIWNQKGGNDINAHQQSTADTFPYEGIALALHLVRWLSVLCSAVTVLLTFALTKTLFPTRRSIAVLATTLVAFNPQFLFISAAAMNDSLVVMAATGSLWQMLRAARKPFAARQWFGVGLWLSVAVLSKINGVALIPLAGGVLLACAIRDRADGPRPWAGAWNTVWRGGLAMALPLIVFTGWWFGRNVWLYGDVLGNAVWMQRYPQAIRTGTLLLLPLFREQLRSFWGVFGWMTVAAPPWFHFAVQGLMLASVVGLFVYAVKVIKNRATTSRYEVFGVGFCVATVLYQQLIMVQQNMVWTTATQGRYLFPIIAPGMILTALGLRSLVPGRAAMPVLGGLAAMCAIVALYMPIEVIAPNYTLQKTLPKWSLWNTPNPMRCNFGHQLGLRGYKVERASHQALHLRLYWVALQQPPFDYSSFAHLYRSTDAAGADMLAQQDQAPGTNLQYPPSAWSKGDIVLDERLIQLKQPLPAGSYRIQLGVYDARTGDRLPAFDSGNPIGDSVQINFAVPAE